MEAMAYGDGTITRRPDGRLQIVVTIEGRRTYRMIAAREVKRDPRGARRKAEAIRRQLVDQREGAIEPSSQTLEGWLRSWLVDLQKRHEKYGKPRTRTLDHYRLIVERHIIPTLGSVRLDRLTERHVQRWLDGDGSAPRSVHHHRAVLRRALNIALRQRLIARNAAIAVELPEVDEFEGKPFTIDEARRFLDVTSGDRLSAMWWLLIDAGSRIGEVLALGWDHIDYDAATVRIEAQLTRRHGSWVRDETKAARSLKVVSLMPQTVAALRAHELRQKAERTPDWRYWGHVFLTTNGNPYHQSEVLKAFRLACDRAGVARRRVHDLRYTSQTILKELGVPEDVRMARAGHETEKMSRKYGQSRTGIDRAAADALGRALA